jgi:hypothetical protein
MDDLETLVRDAAPRPSAEFILELDERVAKRFEKPPKRRWWQGIPMAPALATACALLIAVPVGVFVLGSGEDGDDVTTITPFSSAPQAADEAAAGAGSGAAAEPAPTARQVAPLPPTSPGSRVAPNTTQRRVIRDHSLVLAAQRREFAEVTDGVIRVTDRFGGVVQRSDVNQTGSSGRATFDLRIPVTRLDTALAELSRLAHVRSRNAASEDVTGRFLSAQERVAEARADREALLRALSNATTEEQADRIRAQLREVNARLARARGDLTSLRRRTDLARVNVTVETARRGEGVGPGEDDGQWTPGDALRDAGRVLEVAAGVALIVLAALVPLGLLAALGFLGARVMRRRRREAALG